MLNVFLWNHMESDEQCKTAQKLIANIDLMLKPKFEDSSVLIREQKIAGGIGKDIENIRSPFHVDVCKFWKCFFGNHV